MTDDRKQAEEIEREILQEFFDNGDIVDDNFGRFYERRKGIISTAMLDFHAQQLAEMMPDAEEVEKTAGSIYADWANKAYAIAGFKDAIVWLRSRLLNNK